MRTNERARPHACQAAKRLLASLLLACSAVEAGTILEYTHDGDCATEFERMAISGLHARIDMRVEGMSMSTLFDDDEQLMHQLMHDTHTYMTMESDDDAVDFTSDVGRSVSLHAEKQAKAITGMDNAQGMAAFREMQVAACPEMAALGFSDPDYADAAQRCAQKMANAAPVADRDRRKAIEQRVQQREARPLAPAASAAGAPVKWSTTTTERADAAATVDARTCIRERIVRGAVVLREDCMAPVDSVGLEPRAMRRLKRIAKVGKGMGEGIASLHPEAETERAAPPAISLERTCYRDGSVSGHARLRIDMDATVDSAAFELPAGYAPLQMPRPADAAPAQALERLQQAGARQR